MSSSKDFHARNKARSILVIVDFNDDNIPVQVRCAEGRRVYEIKSIVERHGLLTIRDVKSYDLLSVFYNPSPTPGVSS